MHGFGEVSLRLLSGTTSSINNPTVEIIFLKSLQNSGVMETYYYSCTLIVEYQLKHIQDFLPEFPKFC